MSLTDSRIELEPLEGRATQTGAFFAAVGTEPERMEYLRESCAAYGLSPWYVELGLELEWKGFGMKWRLMREWMERAPIDEDTWIIFNDGYDTACQQPLARIQEVLTSLDPDRLLVSAELYPWPQEVIPEALERVGPVDGTYKFPCSGQYAGTRQALRHLYDSSNVRDEDDDQMLLHRYCAKYPERIAFDSEHRLFHANIFRLRDDMIVEKKKKFEKTLNHELELRVDPIDSRKKFFRIDTGVAACFVHANGSRTGIGELHRERRRRRWLPW